MSDDRWAKYGPAGPMDPTLRRQWKRDTYAAAEHDPRTAADLIATLQQELTPDELAAFVVIVGDCCEAPLGQLVINWARREVRLERVEDDDR